MTEPNEPDPGEPEFSQEREAEMEELNRRADLVEETTNPNDDAEDAEQ